MADEPYPGDKRTVVHGDGRVATESYTYGFQPAPSFGFEHDSSVRVFRLIGADGSVEVLRDNPTRHLCVEPYAQSGAMRPVVKLGRPMYLYLCREEWEVR